MGKKRGRKRKQKPVVDVKQSTDVKKCKEKRTKERSIASIIDKVKMWRELYNGVNPLHIDKKFSLEDAAQIVGISKKSLDDYLL